LQRGRAGGRVGGRPSARWRACDAGDARVQRPAGLASSAWARKADRALPPSKCEAGEAGSRGEDARWRVRPTCQRRRPAILGAMG
jgi:hypothetical protein